MGKLLAGMVFLVIAAILGIVAFLQISGRSSEANLQNTQEQAMTEGENSESNSTIGSLRDLLGAGQSQQCSFEDTSSGSTGVVYASGGMMRGDYSVPSQDTVIHGHMIVKDENIYIWTEGEQNGFMTSTAMADDADTSPKDRSVNLDDKVDVDCSSWSADTSVFEIPEDVDFQDFSTMMEGAMEGLKNEPALDCSVCDELPEGEAQTSCRSSLGC